MTDNITSMVVPNIKKKIKTILDEAGPEFLARRKAIKFVVSRDSSGSIIALTITEIWNKSKRVANSIQLNVLDIEKLRERLRDDTRG